MKCLYQLSLFIFLFSCASESEEQNYRIITREDFKEISIASEKHYFEEIINPVEIGLIGDKIIISEAHRVLEENPRIHLINSADWSYDKAKGKYGEGPLELIDASSFFEGGSSDTFWAYSMNRRKLVEYSTNDSSFLGIKEWKMTEPMMNLWFFMKATDSTYLGISREDKNRILEFDLEGKKIGGYGEWEIVEDRPNLTENQLSTLNESWFKGNPDQGLFLRVGLRRDRLEIFDNQDKSFIIVDGPDLEIPPFELIDAGGVEHLYIDQEDPYRYGDAFITDSYIYALYRGVNQVEVNKTGIIAEQIWVFDHKGKPLWNLKLERSILRIVVNEQTNEIYGLTTDQDPGIAVFQIPEELLD